MPKDFRFRGFVLDVDDFASDGKVELMTTEEVGAYFLLLLKAWREKPPGTLPRNDDILARWARLSLERWTECSQRVLSAFRLGGDGRYYQKRMVREYNALKKRYETRKAAGLRGAQVRYGRELDSNAIAEPVVELQQSHSPPFNSISSSSPNGDPVEKKKKKRPVVHEYSVIGLEVFAYWKLVMGHDRAQMSEKRDELILARVSEGYTVEDLKAAVDGCKKSRYHQGENDRNAVYDDIDLICRDAKRVDQFIATAKRLGRQDGPSRLSPKEQTLVSTTLAWVERKKQQCGKMTQNDSEPS